MGEGPELTPAVVHLREATAADRDALAALHTVSMRAAYAGILPSAYLADDLAGDRLSAWRARFADPDPGAVTFVVERGPQLLGLAHAVLDVDAEWGSLLESLHVDPGWVGDGLGRRLFCAVAREVGTRARTRKLHLWVYDRNTGAQRFYEALDGVRADVTTLGDGGGAIPSVRYAWADVGRLDGC